MLHREIIDVFVRIYIKHINTPCGQKVECLNVRPGSTWSNNWALKRYITVEEYCSASQLGLILARYDLCSCGLQETN